MLRTLRVRAITIPLSVLCTISSSSLGSLRSDNARQGAIKLKTRANSRSTQVSMAYKDPLVYDAREKHTATVILIHGLGDSGAGWAPFGPELGQDLPYTKFLFPNAQQMPISLNGGMRMPGWYDLYSLERLEGKEDTVNIRASSEYIQSLVEKEISDGLPSNRVLVAGFSQGAALALLSLRQPHQLAGVLSMSGYLLLENEPLRSEANRETPLLMCHGELDQVVAFRYGQQSYQALKGAGVNVAFKQYPYAGHELAPQEVKDVKAFLKNQLPPV